MKLVALLVVLVITACGSSNNSESNNSIALAGTWVSNCAISVDGIQNITYYYIATLVIENDGTYTQNEVSYDDAMCTNLSGNIDNYFGAFVLGPTVQSTDGSDVQVVTTTKRSPAWPDSLGTLQYDEVYRITGMELNFGGYGNARPPSLYYGLTYTKST